VKRHPALLALIPAALLLLHPELRTAVADTARFEVTASGAVTAEINGTAWPLPADFGMARNVTTGSDGTQYWCLHSFRGYNGHHPTWIGGATATPAPSPFVWHGHVGTFSGIDYPGGGVELYPMPLFIAGYPMARLVGEPVWVLDTLPMGSYSVVIGGGSPLRVHPRGDVNFDGVVGPQDVFDFLEAWFAGEMTADFSGDDALSVQDLFEFLAAYFG
jgi:hypothetical protein